jgi:hypothetical protein
LYLWQDFLLDVGQGWLQAAAASVQLLGCKLLCQLLEDHLPLLASTTTALGTRSGSCQLVIVRPCQSQIPRQQMLRTGPGRQVTSGQSGGLSVSLCVDALGYSAVCCQAL